MRITEEMSNMKVGLLAMAFGFFLVTGTAVAGPTDGGGDPDGDGVQAAFDNCLTVSNANQADSNHNGCGDACDFPPISCDFAPGGGDGIVGSPDTNLQRANFGTSVPTGTAGDCAPGAGDGLVGSPDTNLARSQFGNQTGPSGITTAQCDPATCFCTPQ